MSNMRIRWRGLGVLVALVALSATTVTPTYAAKGSPGPPHPPTEEEGDEAGNNLSVPALFVPDTSGSPFTGMCTDDDDSKDPVPPMGVDLNQDGVYDDHLDYYVQGVTTWQADCATALSDNTLTVGAEWGDNLTNAPLKARTPIRVEIGFLADPAAFPLSGYVVEKLDPSLLDRESHYGTLGNEVTLFPEVRVWNSGVTLEIRSSAGTVVYNGAYTAEVNSTGRVVYGFNWQKPLLGEYTLTVTTNGIALVTTDAGTLVDNNDDGLFDAVELDVNVGNKGGGGGGGGGRPPDRPRK